MREPIRLRGVRMTGNKTVKKPLLCRFGFHSWYSESSMYTTAKRCNRCLKFADVRDEERLKKEWELWEQEKENQVPFNVAMDNVKRALFRLES